MKKDTAQFPRITGIKGLFAVIFVVGSCGMLRGQGGGQTITGTVRDTSGAVVPGASVIVRDVDTGVKYQLETNSRGVYVTPPGLKPGDDFQIQVSKSGFETLVRRGVILHLGEILGLNLTLTVGSSKQLVTVTAPAPALDTQNSAMGAVVVPAAVDNVPLVGHRMGGLLAIVPGAYYQGESIESFNAPRFNVQGSANMVATIDGDDASQGRTNVDQIELSPPVDSIQEVQVQESSYSAEYGGAEGGVVKITTKSGTNQWHGTGYEYYRNAALDARSFFAATRGPDNYNLFGGSVGGPIKKDRVFFFLNVEGTKESNPSSGTLTIPTIDQVNGDFSGSGETIYDPATTVPDPAQPGQFIRSPFPGDIIPQNRFDPTATKALKFYAPVTSNTVSASWSNDYTRHAWVGRIDYNATTRDRLSFDYVYDSKSYTSTNPLQNNGTPVYTNRDAAPNSWDYVGLQWNHMYVFEETHTFSPTVVNTFRLGEHRVSPAYTPDGQVPGWTSYFDLKNVIKPPDLSADLGFPEFGPSGYNQIGPGIEVLNTAGEQGDWEGHDMLMVVRGRQTFRFGGDLEHTFASVACGDNPTGIYNFNQESTYDPVTQTGGNGVASMELGQVISGSITDCPYPPFYLHQNYFAPYVQDDIRATKNLTINAGLRWELDLPLYEKFNRGSGFDPYEINPVSGTPGVITFQGEPGVSPGWFHTDWVRFEPRFGFAYELGSKTVVRGGYGIYGQTLALGTNRGAPELGFQDVNASFSSTNVGITPAFILSDGFPTYPIGATRDDAYGAVAVGQSPITNPSFVNPYWHPGYTQNFNLSIQRQLPGQILVQLAGTGALGRHLSMQTNINEVPPSLWGLTGNAQVRRPYPQFGSITDVEASEGVTNYWGGQIEASKNAGAGLFLLSSLTWQKELGFMSEQSNYINSLTYGPVLFNLSNGPTGQPPWLLKIAAVYDLPAGPGRRYVRSGPASWALGGWTIGANFNYASGAPMGIGTTNDSLNCECGAGSRVNQVLSQPVKGPQTPTEWFNPLIAVSPMFGQIGTMGIALPGLLSPSDAELDMSLSKAFTFHERYSVKISADAFNISNTPQFGGPDTTLGTAGYDRITGAVGLGTGAGFSPPYDLARILQLGIRFIW